MFRPEPVNLSPTTSRTSPASREAHLLELLTVCETFLRTASPTIHDELREFLTAQGWHPVTGLPAFLDVLGFATSA